MPVKFSIRDLLLVTVIVALLLGWWLDHRRHQREGWRQRAAALAEAVKTDGWEVVWGQEYVWFRPPNESWTLSLLRDALPSAIVPDPDDTPDQAALLDGLAVRQKGIARQWLHSQATAPNPPKPLQP